MPPDRLQESDVIEIDRDELAACVDARRDAIASELVALTGQIRGYLGDLPQPLRERIHGIHRLNDGAVTDVQAERGDPEAQQAIIDAFNAREVDRAA